MELPCHSGQMRQLINSVSLAAPDVVPPIVFPLPPEAKMPDPVFGRAAEPVALVPMKFPSTTSWLSSSRSRPPSPFPEMTLAAPDVVPPIVFPLPPYA